LTFPFNNGLGSYGNGVYQEKPVQSLVFSKRGTILPSNFPTALVTLAPRNNQ